jgi:hypothetical protein
VKKLISRDSTKSVVGWMFVFLCHFASWDGHASSARNSCSSLFGSSSFPLMEIGPSRYIGRSEYGVVKINAKPGVSFDDAQFVRTIIETMNHEIFSALKIPGETEINLSATSADAWAEDMNLFVPVRFGGTTGSLASRERSAWIIAHEYGHVLFELNFRSTIFSLAPSGPQSRQAMKAINRRLKKLEEIRTRLERTLRKENRSNVYGKIKGLIEAWHRLDMRVRGELDASMDVRLPFEELFGDLAAVLYAKDKDAISSVLEETIPDYDHRYRKFSGDSKVRDLNVEVEFDVFGPTRAFIGNTYLSQAAFATRPELLVKAVLNACIKEIFAIEASPELKKAFETLKNPSLFNARLQRQIAREVRQLPGH